MNWTPLALVAVTVGVVVVILGLATQNPASVALGAIGVACGVLSALIAAQ